MTPLLGGWLADNVLGQRRAVVIGGLLMMLGHFLMAVPDLPEAYWLGLPRAAPLYVALAFIMAGNGFFKPNISVMVGQLYPPGDARRDAGFTIFYMGINLGALLGALVCGTLGERVGWAFGLRLRRASAWRSASRSSCWKARPAPRRHRAPADGGGPRARSLPRARRGGVPASAGSRRSSSSASR